MVVVRDDPYSTCNFLVVINGVLDDGRSIRGSFAEVSGLDVTISPIEYRNGSEDITVRKLPGRKKFSNIVLNRPRSRGANAVARASGPSIDTTC